MKAKSIFVGSALALINISGAQADYLRTCDAYGPGFFFIPGTETCLRTDGFVRSSYESLWFDNEDPAIDDRHFTLWGQRARLNVDTRNETELGTLRALYRLEGGQSNVDTDVDMDVALISLAGLRAGFAGANYWSSNHGFGWVNAESVATNAEGVIYPDGFYGFDDATIFDYTFAVDGFSVTVGLEDPRISYGRGGFGNATNDGADGEVNFYAGFSYSGDGFGFAATAVHDSLATKTNMAGAVVDRGGWAYKVSANLDLSEFVPGGTLWGVYMNDGDYDTDYVHSNLLTSNPENIWGVAFQMNLTDEVEFWVNYWDVDGTDNPLVGVSSTGNVGQGGVGINWYPESTPGIHVKTAYYSGNLDNAITPLPVVTGTAFSRGVDAEYDGFEVTIRRSF